ncbi:diminuto-like protein [Frankliniella occidentalis]|uniref:Diminuto-like protein n=1 Tax=Frankliniella occidentalis TaxID=133901 RepID=A0A9C6XAF0_FRAOC|nr:diminuto-like protein [Frankliniella occidentalis]
MLGDFSDGDLQLPVNHIAAWYKPWWYKYVEGILRAGREHTELVPMREYLLRHNRAIFWVVEDMLPNGNHPLFRALLGWLLPPKPAFLKFTTTPGIRALTFAKQVFQDIVLPVEELEQQVDTSELLFDSYPLLVYPCRVYDRGPRSGQLRRPPPKYLVPGTDYAMYNDLGVYGVPGKVRPPTTISYHENGCFFGVEVSHDPKIGVPRAGELKRVRRVLGPILASFRELVATWVRASVQRRKIHTITPLGV